MKDLNAHSTPRISAFLLGGAESPLPKTPMCVWHRLSSVEGTGLQGWELSLFLTLEAAAPDKAMWNLLCIYLFGMLVILSLCLYPPVSVTELCMEKAGSPKLL